MNFYIITTGKQVDAMQYATSKVLTGLGGAACYWRGNIMQIPLGTDEDPGSSSNRTWGDNDGFIRLIETRKLVYHQAFGKYPDRIMLDAEFRHPTKGEFLSMKNRPTDAMALMIARRVGIIRNKIGLSDLQLALHGFPKHAGLGIVEDEAADLVSALFDMASVNYTMPVIYPRKPNVDYDALIGNMSRNEHRYAVGITIPMFKATYSSGEPVTYEDTVSWWSAVRRYYNGGVIWIQTDTIDYTREYMTTIKFVIQAMREGMELNTS